MMKSVPRFSRLMWDGLCGLFLLSLIPNAVASTTVLLDDPMDDLGAWTDLSRAVSWTGAPVTGSAFETVSGVLRMNAEALGASMWGAGGIRSFSAIDFPFPRSVDHSTNTITVEFRMRWETVTTTGEANRVAFMLLHDYPASGVDTTTDLLVGDFSEQWFARPAYQLRIRGGFNASDAAPYLMYGGGLDVEGEFETQKDGEDPLYWLPGFVSAAGGTSPGTTPTENYPESSWVMGDTAPASVAFKRYRYRVEPHAQSLWVDHDDDGVGFVKILEMPLPLEENAPTDPAPPLYHYFEHLQALRIYFRSPGTGGGSAAQVHVDSVKITVDGDYALESPTTITLNNESGDYHETAGPDSSLTEYRFSKTLKNYPASIESTGLRYTGGAPVQSAARLTISDVNGSPIAGATGAGTMVHFRGSMAGDGNNTYATLALLDGGHWLMEREADLDFIQGGSLFTRQLWVYGDGTGTLEFAEGFIADHTLDGTRGDGIASVRLRNSTLITHHTRSLPVAPRPDGSGGLQINGHLVFENAAGSTWITRTHPQTYTGAVWIGVDAAIRTEADLTHAGITQFSSHMGTYWAANAFQTTAANVRVEKTGPARLIFSEETAFLPGSVLAVLEGGVAFRKNPAAGFLKASPTTQAGPELNLEVRDGGHVEIDTPLAEMATMDLQPGGELILEAQPDGGFPQVTLTGTATLAGTLVFRNSGAYSITAAPADILSASGNLDTNGLNVVNETDGDFAVVESGGTLGIEAAAPFSGRAPKFFYYQADGRFIYLGMGDAFTPGTEVPLIDWSLDAPPPQWQESQPGGAGSWTVGYSAGAASWADTSGAGAHGRYHVATFAAGLDESDFGQVDHTFAGGVTGTVPVIVIRRGVVIDEDWSDGAFDAAGWQLVNHPDIGLFSTGRSDPAYGLARVLNDFIWPVAYFHTDHFAAGPEDVLVIRMTSFSDVAFNNAEFAKPEVAALHDNPDHEFRHNHAAELSRHYYTLNGANQLRPSVDNAEISLSNMHHAGGSTAATLENAETALGIFRTLDTGTQVETFGELNKAEAFISGRFLMEDNFIQISVPRSYDASRGPVHRGDDVNNRLVGLSRAHVGVTARTDANLDYATDAYDFMYLNSHYGNSGTHLPTGDIDNDGDTDADDLALLAAAFGEMHNPGGRMAPVATMSLGDLPGAGTAPRIGFNATTRELILIPDPSSPVAALVVEAGPDPLSRQNNLVWSGDWKAAAMADGLHWMDASRLGVSEPVVLATYPQGTLISDFGSVTVGYSGGGADTVAVTTTSLDPDPIERFGLHRATAGFEIRFGTQTGFRYQVQTSSNLNEGWTDHGSAVVGNGASHSMSLSIPLQGDAAFYRVGVSLEP
jgi:hypothetical protein